MKKERTWTVLVLLVNAFVVLLKIYGGMVFDSYLLMVSGYYTLCEMAIVFVAFSGSIARGRRASRSEPFGFGKKECGSVIGLGLLLELIAIYIFIKSFFLNYSVTDLRILLVVAILMGVQFWFANLLFKVGKELQSDMSISTSKGMYNDANILGVSIVLLFLSGFNKWFDFAGSLVISLLILVKGMRIVVNNYYFICGKNFKKKSIIDSIKKIVLKSDKLTYSNSDMINVGDSYKLLIEGLISDDLGLEELIREEQKIKREIKKENKEVKVIDFTIYKKN